MKHRLLYVFIVIMLLVFPAACSKESVGDKNVKVNGLDTVMVSELTDNDVIQDIDYVNIKADSVEIKGIRAVDKVYSFAYSYYPRLSNKEAYEEFVKSFKNIFQEYAFDERAVVFFGERTRKISSEYYNKCQEALQDINAELIARVNKGEIDNDEYLKLVMEEQKKYNDSHPVVYPSVQDYRNEIFSGEEKVEQYQYDCALSGRRIENEVFMNARSPVGNDIFAFNREVAAKYYYNSINKKVPSLELFRPSSLFELVDTYSPDSDAAYSLMDKTVQIRDAVDFFENYVNETEISDKADPNLKIKVVSVDVYKVSDSIYFYDYFCTAEYKGVNRDYLMYGSQGPNAGNPVNCSGGMIKSDEVDYLSSYPRVWRVFDEEEHERIITAKVALSRVSELMSSEVVFELKDIELVYYSEDRTSELSTENFADVKIKTVPQWKLTLYNTNDEKTYIVYIGALDGEGFHYNYY